MQMYIKKLANATENAFADRSMMLGENEELFRQNCEKEVRASTRAKKVGTARVMKYEDILKEQELREKKESKKRARPGRPKKKQLEPDQQKQNPKRRKYSERDTAISEIAASGLEDYCSVMEF
ncbi:hypothetical protein K432DRAFT_393193 [Lepidopterella palustris CBS 459.81]|uniref:Uncharacterized protein n=1 Tax=Lepidopterella palustris CBS 459.81 TaxID=1314670 RepID=A0A8E2JF29_9PEZI|nr:hypothetical protein K432DRAFT_393193 [Lepidopterella palustris CBS 459.81]